MAPSPPSASVRDNAVGIVLIVGAVLVGLLLLVKGYDSEGGVVATGAESSSQTTVTTASAEVTTTTSPVTTNPPAQVSVMVANASGGSGLASQTQSTLQGKGYTQVAITNAPSVVTSTQILYVEGSKGDAEQVAAALGVDAAAVQPMPTPPPVALSGATVLVLAGPDLA
ncbi:MAG TPA: LytR C-terminal domain-containing protein [Acidimicrobiales bacterium]